MVQSDDSNLFSFAYCGDRENDFKTKRLSELAALAEDEEWSSKENPYKYDRLFYYIIKIFEVIHKQNLLVFSSSNDFAVFNTGLVTDNGEDIYGYFVPNLKRKIKPDAQKWFFKGFVKESDRALSKFIFDKPELAKFVNDYSEFYFDISLPMTFSADHIFDDHFSDEDDKRYPKEILDLGPQLAIASIRDAFNITKRKIKRNYRLAVPQYYKGKIMFLLPVSIPVLDGKHVTMAIAVEKMENNTYRANTIFSLEDAYKKARLIMKPESNWLME